jgi:hypothetical protein
MSCMMMSSGVSGEIDDMIQPDVWRYHLPGPVRTPRYISWLAAKSSPKWAKVCPPMCWTSSRLNVMPLLQAEIFQGRHRG